jgi:hypothetical protein
MSRRLALWAAAFAAGIGVAIALNVVLLGLAGERDDPVGRLSPIAVVPPAPGSVTAEPTTETQPPAAPSTTGEDDHDGDDD